MDRKRRVIRLFWAAAWWVAVLVTPMVAAADSSAPLPVQIPIRDVNEPPTPPLELQAPFVPSRGRHTVRRRHKTTYRRHRTTRRTARARTTARKPAATGTPQATPPARPTPKVELRHETPTESIMPLGPLPAPATTAATPAAATGQPAQATTAPPPGPTPNPAPPAKP